MGFYYQELRLDSGITLARLILTRIKKTWLFVRLIWESRITNEVLEKVAKLNELASGRNQTLAEMALSWVLRKNRVTTVLIGASKAEQIEDNAKIIENLEFTEEELNAIERVLNN